MMGSGSAFYVYDDLDRTKRRRDRRTPFDKSLRYYKDDGKKLNFPKLTELQLSTIRKKIQKQNSQLRRKTILIFSIVGSITVTLMYYFLFVYQL